MNKFAFRKILKTSNEESFDKIKIIFKHWNFEKITMRLWHKQFAMDKQQSLYKC